LRNRQDDGIVRRFEMPVAEERLSMLEAKMEQVGTTLARMEAILMSLDQKVDKLDHRVDRLELRIDKLDDRVVKLFLWVIGIQMTTLITIAAGLFAMVARLIPNP
jgi:predicted nuclease with TOPRIM domain